MLLTMLMTTFLIRVYTAGRPASPARAVDGGLKVKITGTHQIGLAVPHD
jgi:hypothetical protein